MRVFSHKTSKIKYSTMIHSSSLLASAILALLCTITAHAADDYQEARRLHAQGNLTGALERVEAQLARQPRDARLRFLKGVILSEQGRQPEAIRVFTTMTEDFPELPEPYNNLAVIYAAQGQDDKARRALETAIRTHPSYATAHENLGDIYAKMAREAYDKALQLDSSNSTARVKLALIKDLFSQRADGSPPLVRSTVSEPPALPAPAVPPVASAAPQRPPVPVEPPPTTNRPEAPPAVAAATGRPGGDGQGSSRGDDEAANEVIQALQNWARAWSAGDVKQYLSHYAPGFRPPGKQSRAAWEASRRERVAKGKGIAVQIQSPKVTFARAGEAVVTFRQIYRSASLNTSGRKRVTMTRSGSRWLILKEEVVR
jgi:tetratricopeptide (TPR) repeat protein